MRTLIKVIFSTSILWAATPASASSIEVLDAMVTGSRDISSSMTLLTALPASCTDDACRAVRAGNQQVIAISKAGLMGSQTADAQMMFTASNIRENAGTGRVMNVSFARKFPDPAVRTAPAPRQTTNSEESYVNPDFDENGNPIVPSDVGEVPAQAPADQMAPVEQASAAPETSPVAVPVSAAPASIATMELRTGG